MDAVETSQTVRRGSAWPQKLRLAVAVGLVWAALHYVVDATVLSRGLDRPVTVLVGGGVTSGIMAAIVVLVLLLAGALVGMLLCGRRDGAQGLLVVGLGLALWAFHGGTMDDWLKTTNTVAGPPTGAAYWPLLAEYVYWAIVVAAVLAVGALRGRAAEGETRETGWRKSLGFDTSAAGLRDGIVALILSTAVAATLMFILTGPRVGHTYRGQVYFAVAVAFIVAVLVARRVSGAGGIIWYLPGPLVVGIAGVLLAVARPALGSGYENINVIPAWGLVRPLPIEMVGVGLVAILLTSRVAARLSSEEDQD